MTAVCAAGGVEPASGGAVTVAATSLTPRLSVATDALSADGKSAARAVWPPLRRTGAFGWTRRVTRYSTHV